MCGSWLFELRLASYWQDATDRIPGINGLMYLEEEPAYCMQRHTHMSHSSYIDALEHMMWEGMLKLGSAYACMYTSCIIKQVPVA